LSLLNSAIIIDKELPPVHAGGKILYISGLVPDNDIIKQLKLTLTPHHIIFDTIYATLLFAAGVEPLIAMKILGHTDYQTTL